MIARPISSRRKIISAAAELAGEVGPANLSLEAIAARAGLSKGGLLYNFPSKAKLLEAIVQQYVDDFEAALETARCELSGSNPTARAFLTLFYRKLDSAEPPPSGILAALGEGLNFLQPVRTHSRTLLDRLVADGMPQADAVLVFAAVEGMRSMRLFQVDVMTDEERQALRERLFAIAEGTGAVQA